MKFANSIVIFLVISQAWTWFLAKKPAKIWTRWHFIFLGVLDCDRLVGFEAVYRVCFGMCCFYWLFMIIMVLVRSSRDPRSGIQNGFWGIKFIIFIALIIAAFFIPSGKNEIIFYLYISFDSCKKISIRMARCQVR